MSTDPTEQIRRELQAAFNHGPRSREELEAAYPGDVYDTQELQETFVVNCFLAPFVVVARKADGQRGTLTFQHAPRFFFHFQEG